MRPFAARAGELYSSVRHLVNSECWYLIDMKAADVNLAGRPECFVNIPCEHPGLEAIIGVVDHPDCVIERFVRVHRYHGAESFFGVQTGMRGNVDQDRGLESGASPVAPGHYLGPRIARLADPVLHAFGFLLRDQRADLRGILMGRSDAELACQFRHPRNELIRIDS